MYLKSWSFSRKKNSQGQKPEEKRGFRYLSARNHVSINRGFSYGRCGLSYTQFGHWRMGARGVGAASTTFTSWGGGGGESWKLKEIARTAFLYVDVGSPASGKKDGARSEYVITEQPLNIIQ